MNNTLIIASRFNKLFESKEFEISQEYIKYIHKYLFNGILDNPGNYRIINILKEEDILNGESIIYSNFFNIESYLEYDLNEFKNISFNNLSDKDIIRIMSELSVRLWLTHPFMDGNTRTISVFIRKYFNFLGYSCDNRLFYKYFKTYRDSLVAACYENKYVSGNIEYLKQLYGMFILGKNIDIKKIDNDIKQECKRMVLIRNDN